MIGRRPVACVVMATLAALAACSSSDPDRTAKRPDPESTAPTSSTPAEQGPTRPQRDRTRSAPAADEGPARKHRRKTARTPEPRKSKRPKVTLPGAGPSPPPSSIKVETGPQRVAVTLQVLGSTVTSTPAAPSGSPLELVLTAADARSHQVSLATPEPRSFRVPAQGGARIALAPLRPGSYAVEVDGQPGPARLVVYPDRSRE